MIDNLVDSVIFGEEALEFKVENVDAIKSKRLELEHELKLNQLVKEDGFKLTCYKVWSNVVYMYLSLVFI